MKEVKFSIVIPVYNAKEYLQEALNSILQQDYKNYEIVIVNNGSEDNSQNIIDNFMLKNPDITVNVIKLYPNKGISYARNIGAQNSTGDYIAFLDADDYWYPNKLKRFNQILQVNPDIDVLWHWENHISQYKNIVMKYKTVNNSHPYEDLLFIKNQLSPSATAIRKGVFTDINGFDERFINGEEDYDCWLRLARKKVKFYLVKESLGVFRIHGGSKSSKYLLHFDAIIRMLSEHFEWMSNHNFYSKKYLNKKLNKRKAEFKFAAGHIYSKENNKKEAFKFYLESIKLRPFWYKAYAGIILIPFAK